MPTVPRSHLVSMSPSHAFLRDQAGQGAFNRASVGYWVCLARLSYHIVAASTQSVRRQWEEKRWKRHMGMLKSYRKTTTKRLLDTLEERAELPCTNH